MKLRRTCWASQLEEDAYLRPCYPTLVCSVHQRANSQPQLFLFVPLPQRLRSVMPHRHDATTATNNVHCSDSETAASALTGVCVHERICLCMTCRGTPASAASGRHSHHACILKEPHHDVGLSFVVMQHIIKPPPPGLGAAAHLPKELLLQL